MNHTENKVVSFYQNLEEFEKQIKLLEREREQISTKYDNLQASFTSEIDKINEKIDLIQIDLQQFKETMTEYNRQEINRNKVVIEEISNLYNKFDFDFRKISETLNEISYKEKHLFVFGFLVILIMIIIGFFI